MGPICVDRHSAIQLTSMMMKRLTYTFSLEREQNTRLNITHCITNVEDIQWRCYGALTGE